MGRDALIGPIEFNVTRTAGTGSNNIVFKGKVINKEYIICNRTEYSITNSSNMIYSLRGKINPFGELTLQSNGGYSSGLGSSRFNKISTKFNGEIDAKGKVVVKSHDFVKHNIFTNRGVSRLHAKLSDKQNKAFNKAYGKLKEYEQEFLAKLV